MNDEQKAPFAALHKAEPDRLRAESVALAYKVTGRGSPTKTAAVEDTKGKEPETHAESPVEAEEDNDATKNDLVDPSIF